jgi:YbbR domain-containing protein
MNFLHQLFLNNLTLKLISLVLAFLLWMQIAGQQTVQGNVAVPLEFINMPSELVVTNDYPREVNVLISKPASVQMDERRLAAVVDLRGYSPGSQVVPLTESSIRNLPSGVKIDRIEQRRIRLQFERTMTKLVKVDPEIVGEPSSGFRISQLRTVPEEIRISGPESRIERISEAETAPIDVSGRQVSFNQHVYLDLEDPSLQIEGPKSVDVLVTIEEERREIRLTRIPIEGTADTVKARFSPRVVDLVVTVPLSYTGELDKNGFAAVVATQGIESNLEAFEDVPAITVPPQYQEFVRIKSVSPPVVKVTINR